MTARPDDDALSWAGDDDPTLAPTGSAGGDRPVAVTRPGRSRRDASPQAAAEPAGPDADAPLDDVAGSRDEAGRPGDDADGSRADAAADHDGDDTDAAALSSAALVSLGVLGGIYLLYTIGWLVGGLRLRTVTGLLVDASVSVPALVFAVAAPAIWFATAYALTRGRATWLRFAWLAAGAVLLVPWPFAMLGFGG